MISFKAARNALLKWYDTNQRKLPWRQNTDPYRVLVSEMMLQQTQVKTVLPYYEKFLKKFPTAKKLAKAPEQEVLTAWSGLGYYRRARFLHAAAKRIAESGFPQSEEGLLQLPGIGEYTAAALGSISFGLPLAVVDGNVIRVISRLLALEDDAMQSKGSKRIRAAALDFLDSKRPGDFNQAVMELGALICSPRSPSCALCPLSKHCRAYELGNPEAYPKLPPAAAVTHVRKTVALIQKGTMVLCAPREEGGRMVGLWSFPEAEIKADADAARTAARLAAQVLEKCPEALGRCGVIGHTITRYRIQVEAYRFKASSKPKAPWRWMPLEGLKAMPLASAERRLAALLDFQVGPGELPLKTRA